MVKERAEYTTIPGDAVTIWRATIIFQATVTKKKNVWNFHFP